MNILKLIAAIFLGIMAGVVIIFIIENLGMALYPPPADFNKDDPNALADLIMQAPVGALLFVCLAYAVGSFCGGLIAQLIGRNQNLLDALLVGVVLMAFGVANVFQTPHPTWMIVVSLLCFVPFAFLGGKIIGRKKG